MPAPKGHYRCPRCRKTWQAPGPGGQQVCLRCLRDAHFGAEAFL